MMDMWREAPLCCVLLAALTFVFTAFMTWMALDFLKKVEEEANRRTRDLMDATFRTTKTKNHKDRHDNPD